MPIYDRDHYSGDYIKIIAAETVSQSVSYVNNVGALCGCTLWAHFVGAQKRSV